MATVIKRGARKYLAVGEPTLNYADLSYPGLAERRHICITIGDLLIRVELKQAQDVAAGINALVAEYEK